MQLCLCQVRLLNFSAYNYPPVHSSPDIGHGPDGEEPVVLNIHKISNIFR